MLTGRSASAPLLPLAGALKLLTGDLAAVQPRRVATGAVAGMVAAADIRAPADLPSRPVASRDGWAVSLEDVAGASPYAPVTLPERPTWLECGEALPGGCDTVLPPESVEASAPDEVMADAPHGEGATSAGADQRAGDILARAGERVGAPGVLALALAGIDAVEVRAPRVNLVATGGGSGFIDALTPALATLIVALGCEAAETVRVCDRVGAIADAIGAGEADAVFVIGGSGFGRTDWSAAALAQAGVLQAHGVALRPGDTAGFGTALGRPVLLLPGRPEACLAAFLTLGRPLLQALAGGVDRPEPRAPLVRKVSSTVGMSEVVFVRRTAGGLEPLGGAEIPLRRLMLADGAILVPQESEGYPEGMPAEMIPL